MRGWVLGEAGARLARLGNVAASRRVVAWVVERDGKTSHYALVTVAEALAGNLTAAVQTVEQTSSFRGRHSWAIFPGSTSSATSWGTTRSLPAGRKTPAHCHVGSRFGIRI
jgi:hypothetical protein